MARDLALDRDLSALERTEKQQQARRSRRLLRRFFDMLIGSRQRAAEHEIERFLQRNGGRLTDELEREIGRRFGHRAGE
jgi:hypothetical protein